jgi:hypothetical protein
MAAQDYLDLLERRVLRRSVTLSALGVEEVAWTETDARLVVAALQDSHWAILGGDVLRIGANAPEYTYDSWHSGPRDGETPREFVERTHTETLQYIDAYPNRESHLYTLVCSRVV